MTRIIEDYFRLSSEHGAHFLQPINLSNNVVQCRILAVMDVLHRDAQRFLTIPLEDRSIAAVHGQLIHFALNIVFSVGGKEYIAQL